MYRDELAFDSSIDLHGVIAHLEAFNRSVSHDLRSPLASIVSLSEIAGEALQDNDVAVLHRTLPLIGSQARSCMKMIHSLLHLAQMDQEELSLTPIDLHALVDEVTAQLALAEPRMPTLRLQLPPRLALTADEGLLRPILLNLMANAVKFTRERANPCVELGAFDEGGGVTVYVRDNGVGFDPAQAERLFAPFVRLHGAPFEGHGLGLSIVRCAVRRHGGQVWAESAPDNGACFYFTLPRIRMQ